MTFLTSYIHMSAGQGELTLIMIEVHMIPTRGVMTGRAVFTKLTTVCVISLMARIAIQGRAFELLVHMARLTGDVNVSALQFECGQVVVELCRSPTIRGVTLAAIHTKATLVRIVATMTRITVLLCHLEIAVAACINMALNTGKSQVLSG